ncbi:nickel pincer cofactor biosynthesis protein LarB [candidate division CSSED10-310 bacterium]|uniref:Nickel pincer cofactor biosynthesis protein LarB n=1 Tax=candidate division CSSED10-310 bacterium TaxID=2855610 RepID=A0ABV6YSC6_UNCC1
MWDEEIKKLFKAVKNDEMSIAAACDKLRFLPFEDLGFAKVDTHRQLRKGFPEVVFGEGKSPDMILKIMTSLLKKAKNLLVTRCSADIYDYIKSHLPDACYAPQARLLSIRRDDKIYGEGVISVLTAGTLDIPVAEEAALTAEVMGNKVERIFDIGVAGIHRLVHFKDTLISSRVAIVVAGMEGALPSVVSGLIPIPVIAVPTSIGYGTSFGGISALLAMLNSCASGVVVVNIDNGFGAAYAASLINRHRTDQAPHK